MLKNPATNHSGDPAMTGTGTLEINLIDINDHPPDFIPSQRFICLNSANGTVIKAEDKDSDLNAGPFTFSLPSYPTSKDWTLQTISRDAAFLAYTKGKAPEGVHFVPVSVKDRGGKTTTKTLNVTVCKCDDHFNKCIEPRVIGPQIKTAGAMGLSGGALAAILLSLLLLPLLALLMMMTYKFCCGGAGVPICGGSENLLKNFPSDFPKGSLIQYHDEGAGETLAALPSNGFDTVNSKTSTVGLEKSKGLHQIKSAMQVKAGAGDTVGFGQLSSFTHNDVVSESRMSEMAVASGMISSPGVVTIGPRGAAEIITTMETTLPAVSANGETEMFGSSSMDQVHGTLTRESRSGQGGARWSFVDGSRTEGAPTILSPIYLSSPGPVTTLSCGGGLGHCVQRVEAPVAMSPTNTLRYQEVRGRSDICENAHQLVSEFW
uniref:Cadherin domain-containing protein n=1 Tax=Eptatretus burgeri TaxID=7764 RepID=A0A8C4Q827_EPTBU